MLSAGRHFGMHEGCLPTKLVCVQFMCCILAARQI